MIPVPAVLGVVRAYLPLLALIVGGLAVAYGVQQVRTWRTGYQALQAEVACAEGSHCLRRARIAATAAATAVSRARQAAAEAAQRAEAARAARAAAEAESIEERLSVAQAAEEQWRARFRAAASAAGSSCEVWARLEVPCPVE